VRVAAGGPDVQVADDVRPYTLDVLVTNRMNARQAPPTSATAAATARAATPQNENEQRRGLQQGLILGARIICWCDQCSAKALRAKWVSDPVVVLSVHVAQRPL